MIKILALIPFIFLTGCSTVCTDYCAKHGAADIVVKTEYVVRKAPDTLFDIPPYAKKINSITATQKDVAEWIIESEGRTQILENNIRSLKAFQDAPVLQTETK